jgi:hypothetical protein
MDVGQRDRATCPRLLAMAPTTKFAPTGEVACGIDVGFAAVGKTSAISAFLVQKTIERPRIALAHGTDVLSSTALDRLIERREGPLADERVRLVTLDAPVTSTDHATMPALGRLPDRRFSRGAFSNSKRGPQPSSIRVPKQGWPLYRRGMAILAQLESIGFPYVSITAAEELALPLHGTMEVVPKLTMALLCSRNLLAVARPRTGFFKQIDNWLFSQIFAQTGQTAPLAPGGERQHLMRLLQPPIEIDATVFAEAARIDGLATNAEKHEAIGAFAAGFQGALALAGVACVVGDQESHFLLPHLWHRDWEEAWLDSDRLAEPARRLRVQSHPTPGGDDASPTRDGSNGSRGSSTAHQ